MGITNYERNGVIRRIRITNIGFEMAHVLCAEIFDLHGI